MEFCIWFPNGFHTGKYFLCKLASCIFNSLKYTFINIKLYPWRFIFLLFHVVIIVLKSISADSMLLRSARFCLNFKYSFFCGIIAFSWHLQMVIEIKLLLNISGAQHCDRNSITFDRSLEGDWLLSSNVAEVEAVE